MFLPSPSYQMGAHPSSLWDTLSPRDVPFTKPAHSTYHTTLLLPGSSGGAAPPWAVSSLPAPPLPTQDPILPAAQPQASLAMTKQAQAAGSRWRAAGHYWGERGQQHGKLSERSHLEEGASPRNNCYSRLTAIRNTEKTLGKNTGSCKAPLPLPTCSISGFRGTEERLDPAGGAPDSDSGAKAPGQRMLRKGLRCSGISHAFTSTPFFLQATLRPLDKSNNNRRV